LSLRRGWRTAGPFAVPLVALAAMQWIGTLASPALYDRAPLALAFLSPRTPFLIYASSHSPIVLFVLVASIRSLLADPINYCIGRRLGPAVFQRIEDRGGTAYKVIRISERVIDRFGVLAVACRPNGAMLALAGSRRLNPVATGLAAVFGTVTYVTALALTADAAANPAQKLFGWVGSLGAPLRHQVLSPSPGLPVLGGVLVAAAAALLWWARARQQPIELVQATTRTRAASFTTSRSPRVTSRREPRS
jgi:membrane protein DedA with SNARE-associated domain